MWPRAIGLAVAVIALEMLSVVARRNDRAEARRATCWPLATARRADPRLDDRRGRSSTASSRDMRTSSGISSSRSRRCSCSRSSTSWSTSARSRFPGACWPTIAYVGAWMLFAALCFFHLREIGPARLKLKAGIVFGLGAAAVAAQTLAPVRDCGRWMSRQSYLRDLKPPFLRIAAPQDDEAFFADAGQLKAKLDRARKEESPERRAFRHRRRRLAERSPARAGVSANGDAASSRAARSSSACGRQHVGAQAQPFAARVGDDAARGERVGDHARASDGGRRRTRRDPRCRRARRCRARRAARRAAAAAQRMRAQPRDADRQREAPARRAPGRTAAPAGVDSSHASPPGA